MSTITDIKCVLSQRAFGVFCEKFHIPEEVHPVLPDRDSTMHERPAEKIRLYTRFFDFANFRLPLSTFHVDILRYFHINISQLSVIGAAKVSQVEQGDFVCGGDRRDTDVQPVATAADTISENDYETPGGPSVAGKSRSGVQRSLVGAVLNAEVRGEPIPALPFITSSVSIRPKREVGDHIDSVTGLNLQTVSAPQRFIISSDSSHHSGANITKAEVDSFARPFVLILTSATTVTLTSGPAAVVQEKTVKPSVFAADSSFAGGDPNAGVFSDLIGSNFLVSGIRTVIDPEFDLQKVYVLRWSVTNGPQ
ncbi:hypothetical protein Tco_1389625 [Tanacetum coccineum]